MGSSIKLCEVGILDEQNKKKMQPWLGFKKHYVGTPNSILERGVLPTVEPWNRTTSARMVSVVC